MSDEVKREIDDFLKIFGTSLRHYTMPGTKEAAIAAWNRRSDPALSALREAREYVNRFMQSEARELIARIDAILSGQPEYPESVRKLVEAAGDASG